MVIIVALVVVGLLLAGAVFYAKGKSVNGKEEISSEEVSKPRVDISDDKFNYAVSCSASRLCPVEYVYAEFVGESGSLSAVGNGNLSAGMGHGFTGVIGDECGRYYLPKAISALWVSYAERKAYAIDALIPFDTMVSLFKKDIILKNQDIDPSSNESEPKYIDKHVRFSELDLCFLPGGKVVLYLKTPGRIELLDWSAKGEAYNEGRALRRIYGREECDGIEEYFDIVDSGEYESDQYWLSYVRKNGVPSLLIDKYFERFNYSLNLEFEDTSTSIYNLSSDFTNGESYSFVENYKDIIEFPSRLKEIKAKWDTKEFRYTSWMYFNEEEMLRVFDEAYGEDRRQKGELTIKVSKHNNLFDISLNVGDKSVKLEKTEIRVFQDPIDDPDGDGTLIYKNYEGNHRNLFIDDEGYFQE